MSVTTLTALGVVPVTRKHPVVQVVAIQSPNLRNLRAGLVMDSFGCSSVFSCALLECFRWGLPHQRSGMP
jgi:hypothetical protein